MAPIHALLLVFLMSPLVACRGALADGKSQFDLGSYPEAKRTFAEAESDSRNWSEAERARYALYRGLTLGALGDQPRARVWLRQAKAIDDAHPGSLTAEEARRLHLGLESNAD
jgi:Flp pilus assembly protein TadD